jgi:hypothetical protein
MTILPQEPLALFHVQGLEFYKQHTPFNSEIPLAPFHLIKSQSLSTLAAEEVVKWLEALGKPAKLVDECVQLQVVADAFLQLAINFILDSVVSLQEGIYSSLCNLSRWQYRHFAPWVRTTSQAVFCLRGMVLLSQTSSMRSQSLQHKNSRRWHLYPPLWSGPK